MLLFMISSCTSSNIIDTKKIQNIENKISIRRVAKFKELNNCEKLYYLLLIKNGIYRIPHDDFMELVRIVGVETGVHPSVVDNFAGTLYPNDTLFNHDFKLWNGIYKCDSLIQKKNDTIIIYRP
jgi:hypothetical protein